MATNPYAKRTIRGKTYYVHRLVKAASLGRELTRNEIVHHKNERKRDNDDSNLEMTTPMAHARHHMLKHSLRKVCVICDTTFEPPPSHRPRDRTCGGKCRAVLIGLTEMCAFERAISIADLRARVWRGESLRSVGRLYGIHHRTVRTVARWSECLADGAIRYLSRLEANPC